MIKFILTHFKHKMQQTGEESRQHSFESLAGKAPCATREPLSMTHPKPATMW